MTKQVAQFERAEIYDGTEASKQRLLLPDEPGRFIGKDIKRILQWATSVGASDIFITDGRPIKIQLYNSFPNITRHNLEIGEVEAIIGFVWGEDAIGYLKSGRGDLNKSFAFRDEDDTNLRFRYRSNASPERKSNDVTYDLTFRNIPTEIPELSFSKLPTDLEKALLNPGKGAVIITGGTGSGKTYLMASVIGEFHRNAKYSKRILTSEDPIEFDFSVLPQDNSFSSQSEVPICFESFSEATMAALRRKPTVIFIGESRTKAAIEQMLIACSTGHEVYTTVHSNGFVDTFKRMVGDFPAEQQNGKITEIIYQSRVILSQRLIERIDGKRIAIQEYVIFNRDVIQMLIDGGAEHVTHTAQKVLDKYGHSFAQDLKEKYDAGLISKEVYDAQLLQTAGFAKVAEENARQEMKELEKLDLMKGLMIQMDQVMQINNILMRKLIEQDGKVDNIARLFSINNKEIDFE